MGIEPTINDVDQLRNSNAMVLWMQFIQLQGDERKNASTFLFRIWVLQCVLWRVKIMARSTNKDAKTGGDCWLLLLCGHLEVDGGGSLTIPSLAT